MVCSWKRKIHSKEVMLKCYYWKENPVGLVLGGEAIALEAHEHLLLHRALIPPAAGPHKLRGPGAPILKRKRHSKKKIR